VDGFCKRNEKQAKVICHVNPIKFLIDELFKTNFVPNLINPKVKVFAFAFKKEKKY